MSNEDQAESHSTQAIDQIVIAQADDDSAWEDPIRIQRVAPTPLSIPAELAARAAFLARLHRKPSVAECLTDIIQERVEIEEAAYMDMKHDLAARSG